MLLPSPPDDCEERFSHTDACGRGVGHTLVALLGFAGPPVRGDPTVVPVDILTQTAANGCGHEATVFDHIILLGFGHPRLGRLAQ